jgi:hypothetical protein
MGGKGPIITLEFCYNGCAGPIKTIVSYYHGRDGSSSMLVSCYSGWEGLIITLEYCYNGWERPCYNSCILLQWARTTLSQLLYFASAKGPATVGGKGDVRTLFRATVDE